LINALSSACSLKNNEDLKLAEVNSIDCCYSRS
jgi:hypothetical protein